MGVDSKYCSGCKLILSLDSFYLRSSGQRVSQCKDCRKRINKNNPEARAIIKHRYYLKHISEISKYNQEYQESHKGQRNQKLRNKKRNNPYFRLECNLRRTLADRLRQNKAIKSESVLKLIGCSLEFFRSFIESKWQKKMTWDNWGQGRGYWHLDHIKPVSLFNLSDPEEQKACFHYTNYQPLWQDENVRKLNKY